MKKSIKILGLALVTFSSIASASNLKVNHNLVHFQQSAVVNDTDPCCVTEQKFVSFADPSLIASELGALKKSQKSIDEMISDDSKIIESTAATKN